VAADDQDAVEALCHGQGIGLVLEQDEAALRGPLGDAAALGEVDHAAGCWRVVDDAEPEQGPKLPVDHVVDALGQDTALADRGTQRFAEVVLDIEVGARLHIQTRERGLLGAVRGAPARQQARPRIVEELGITPKELAGLHRRSSPTASDCGPSDRPRHRQRAAPQAAAPPGRHGRQTATRRRQDRPLTNAISPHSA
jgi:hypothetical protein